MIHGGSTAALHHNPEAWLTGCHSSLGRLSLQLLKSLLVACRHVAMVWGGNAVLQPHVPMTAGLSQNRAGRIERILGVQQMVRWLRSENKSDHCHPHICKNYAPKICHTDGVRMACKPLQVKGFLQRIWHTDPEMWHTNPPPPFYARCRSGTKNRGFQKGGFAKCAPLLAVAL